MATYWLREQDVGTSPIQVNTTQLSEHQSHPVLGSEVLAYPDFPCLRGRRDENDDGRKDEAHRHNFIGRLATSIGHVTAIEWRIYSVSTHGHGQYLGEELWIKDSC